MKRSSNNQEDQLVSSPLKRWVKVDIIFIMYSRLRFTLKNNVLRFRIYKLANIVNVFLMLCVVYQIVNLNWLFFRSIGTGRLDLRPGKKRSGGLAQIPQPMNSFKRWAFGFRKVSFF